MPRPAQPAEHAILGLLYFEQGGGHGYDLARHFGDDQPLGDVLKLEPGMLYHHLKKLARTGWVTVDIEPQGTRPPRQVYTLTDDGTSELLRWLREPVRTYPRDSSGVSGQALFRPVARSCPRHRAHPRPARQEPRHGSRSRIPPGGIIRASLRFRPPGSRSSSPANPRRHHLARIALIAGSIATFHMGQ